MGSCSFLRGVIAVWSVWTVVWWSLQCGSSSECLDEETGSLQCVPGVGGESGGFHQDFDPAIRQQMVYRYRAMLEEVTSPYQEIKVFASSFFGHLLVIDDEIMLTDRDESHYHEMIAHVPLNYLPKASRVLIIGGGDGGTLRQVLRHRNVQHATLVDIDEAVVKASKEYFPLLSKAFSDERLTLEFKDGAKWVAHRRFELQQEEGAREKDGFDVVLVDSTDFNRAVSLFTGEFYGDCKALLKEGGVMVVNVESPSYSLDVVASSSKKLSSLFNHVYYYQVHIPTYLSGHYAFVLMSDTVHPFHTPIDWETWKDKGIDTQYYTPDLHYASFALPTFVQKVLHSPPLDMSSIASFPPSPPLPE